MAAVDFSLPRYRDRLQTSRPVFVMFPTIVMMFSVTLRIDGLHREK